MRDMPRLLEALDIGNVEKIVLTQRNQMRAVLITVERFAELQRAADQSVAELQAAGRRLSGSS
jgi:PHD/YefM family antitoxin component YafN of YafNO toxin-antitoxin module